jgi:hypothetical protein
MATTTNYSWSTPDDTALVKDGALAIRTLGSSVDTTVKGLNPETTLGDLAYRSSTANVKTRLGLGTAGQVLQVNSGATAPEWATPVTGGMTLINTGGTALTGTSVSISSIPATYRNLQIVIVNGRPSVDGEVFRTRYNNDSGSNRYFSSNSNGVGSQAFNSTYIDLQGDSDNTATQGVIVWDVYDYTNTSTWKLSNSLAIMPNNTTPTNAGAYRQLQGYNQTTAISEINIFVANGTMSAGTVYVYGVK